MTTPELVTTLQCKGFTLQPFPDGKLSVTPASQLTEALRAKIRQRKDEIVTLLVSNHPYIDSHRDLCIVPHAITGGSGMLHETEKNYHALLAQYSPRLGRRRIQQYCSLQDR
jgi:hypothetical protein